MNINSKIQQYSNWASECKANYEFLVELGIACCEEWFYRQRDDYCDKEYPYKFNSKEEYKNRYGSLFWPKFHEFQSVIEWARDNVPDLQVYYGEKDENGDYFEDRHLLGLDMMTPFPLVMPKKYIFIKDYDHPDGMCVQSYRTYYKAKITYAPFWTRREKPEWLNK